MHFLAIFLKPVWESRSKVPGLTSLGYDRESLPQRVYSRKLAIMIVDIDYLHRIGRMIDKNSAVFAVDSKAKKPHMRRFKKLHMQARMKDVLLKEFFLFVILGLQTALFQIYFQVEMKREYLHGLYAK
jgi:hypothetical protein